MIQTELIRKEMEKREMSVQELAAEAGLSRPTIYDLLDSKREPELKTIQAVSRVLSIPLSKLVIEEAAA